MKTFPAEWIRESEVFTVEVAANSVLLCAKPGREAEFDAFTRRINNSVGHFAAFPRRDARGRYDSVEILATMPQAAGQPADGTSLRD
jgi:hypothetical protein